MKSIILSSLGLKNVVLNKYQDDNFTFIIGEQEFQMKSFFADFISPIVSRLHQTDPTINSIDFGYLKELSKNIVTQETISLLLQISSGFSIEIKEEQAIKLRFLSIILGNEELHNKLNELFQPNYSEENINSYMKNIECCYHFSHIKPDFDFTSLLKFICMHFEQLNKVEFLKLSRNMQYKIISNPNLQIESEDSLFDIIIEIIEKKTENEEIDDVLFLEQIEFTALSEDRLQVFVDEFDINEMSGLLWRKLSQCFFNRSPMKSKRTINKISQKIIVGGFDKYNQLGEKPNNRDDKNHLIISPPLNSSIDSSSVLSYSVYGYHSVLVMNDGSLIGIGYNNDGRISSSLIKAEIIQFSKFSIRDNNGHPLVPISAVCTAYGTLYMLSKNSGIGRQLVYCDREINGGNPIFLDIGDQQPVALFGGIDHAAAICNNGKVIFINRYSIKNSFESKIPAISIPNDEKASSVAFCDNFVIVLSSNGRVFISIIEYGNNYLNFSAVNELANEKIVYVSGSHDHFLSVNEEGRVFGCGSNKRGQLGLGSEIESVSSFTEINSLRGYEIRAAYAGDTHSLFETRDGKILSCGWNKYGQLLLNGGPSEYVYLPIETVINEGATFCIAGVGVSVVFIGGDPPKNTPNRQIQH